MTDKDLRSHPSGAFCAHQPAVFEKGSKTGDLKGLNFAAKDLFAIKGTKTGAGNPDWLSSHDVETRNADAVERLLKAGADLIGKTHTDELAFSLNGENHHYGTPLNPHDHQRIPGGSSSGSASAVAHKLVDFALGTDTGGSVRAPASYCGLFGIRTSHAYVNKQGLVPLAPKFDTVGWFANNSSVFHKVGRALLDPTKSPIWKPGKLIILEDMFAQVGEQHARALLDACSQLAEKSGMAIKKIKIEDYTSSADLTEWFQAFRLLQVTDIWETHGEWIRTQNPTFGPGIKERFEWAETAHKQAHKRDAAMDLQEQVRELAARLCNEGNILVSPASAGVAPLRGDVQGTELQAMDAFREHAMRLTCFSGLSGFPQISVPLATLDDLPVGLALMTAKNTDLALLSWLDSVV